MAMKRSASAVCAQNPASKKRARAEEAVTAPGRVTQSGQYAPSSGRCISTSLSGKPCQGVLPDEYGVPYCSSCRKTGDPSLKVADHPKFGKILVAARDLPPTYSMAWWGKRTTMKEVPEKHLEWALESTKGVIDARYHKGGSLLQFAACPGPNELTTVAFHTRPESLLKKAPLTCLLFSTRMHVPKNHHLCMLYNESIKTTNEFFEERGLVRGDVGTPQYPALQKAARTDLTLSGQNGPCTGRCISTSLSGKPCTGTLPKTPEADGIPYCEKCRKTADPSLRVAIHPKFGQSLVAARDLPKGYYMAWWGDRTTESKIPPKNMEWALVSSEGMIDARPYQGGSVVQFSQCPGPKELTTVNFSKRSEALLKKTKKTCMLFHTLVPVPKNHHLCMMYNEDVKSTNEFFADRGLTRCDVGTAKHPALLKKKA